MLPEHFDLRMNGGRRTPVSRELNESTWRDLRLWLDAEPLAGVPVVAPVPDTRCSRQLAGHVDRGCNRWSDKRGRSGKCESYTEVSAGSAA
jgi:hypothetical protein